MHTEMKYGSDGGARRRPVKRNLCAVSSRFILVAVGVFSIWWGITTFPAFQRDTRVDRAADSILDGETFKPEILQSLLDEANSTKRVWPRPEFLQSVAVIQLKLAEAAIVDGSDEPTGPIFDQLGESIRRSLSAAPADPYLWLALFWWQTKQDDWAAQDFAYLRMSYIVGPNEGWVAVLRNYVAISYFSELPKDMEDAAVTEFKDLVVIEGIWSGTTKWLPSGAASAAANVTRGAHASAGLFSWWQGSLLILAYGLVFAIVGSAVLTQRYITRPVGTPVDRRGPGLSAAGDQGTTKDQVLHSRNVCTSFACRRHAPHLLAHDR